MLPDHQAQHQRTAAFIDQHLLECASELTLWRRTGRLVDPGRMHELAVLIHAWQGEGDPLGVAETLVVNAALARLASQGSTTCAVFQPADAQGPGFYWWRLEPADDAKVVQVLADQSVHFIGSDGAYALPGSGSSREVIYGELAGPLVAPRI